MKRNLSEWDEKIIAIARKIRDKRTDEEIIYLSDHLPALNFFKLSVEDDYKLLKKCSQNVSYSFQPAGVTVNLTGDITKGEAFGKAICSPSEEKNIFYSLEDTHLLVLDSDIGVKKIPFFSDFSPLFLMNLLKISRVLSYNRGDTVFREGQMLNNIYIIKEGEFSIYKIMDPTNSCDQIENNLNKSDIPLLNLSKVHQKRPIKVMNFGKEEIIGEIELIDKQKSTFTLKCESLTGLLLEFNSSNFEKKLSAIADAHSQLVILSQAKKQLLQDYIAGIQLRVTSRTNTPLSRQQSISVQESRQLQQSQPKTHAKYPSNIIRRQSKTLQQSQQGVVGQELRTILKEQSINKQSLITKVTSVPQQPNQNIQKVTSNSISNEQYYQNDDEEVKTSLKYSSAIKNNDNNSFDTLNDQQQQQEQYYCSQLPKIRSVSQQSSYNQDQHSCKGKQRKIMKIRKIQRQVLEEIQTNHGNKHSNEKLIDSSRFNSSEKPFKFRKYHRSSLAAISPDKTTQNNNLYTTEDDYLQFEAKELVASQILSERNVSPPIVEDKIDKQYQKYLKISDETALKAKFKLYHHQTLSHKEKILHSLILDNKAVKRHLFSKIRFSFSSLSGQSNEELIDSQQQSFSLLNTTRQPSESPLTRTSRDSLTSRDLTQMQFRNITPQTFPCDTQSPDSLFPNKYHGYSNQEKYQHLHSSNQNRFFQKAKRKMQQVRSQQVSALLLTPRLSDDDDSVTLL